MSQAKVTIIGAGVMGAATACFLALRYGLRAVLLERDPSFARASSALSASSIRQQFSTAVNIELSQRSWRLLQSASDWLAVEGELPELALTERGYLYLATPAGRSILHENWLLQTAHGASIAWLEPDELAARFPWLATEDLAAGTLGLRGEGWFDGPALHAAFLRKAKSLGVALRQAEVLAFEPKGQGWLVRLSEGESLSTDVLLVAAGAWSGALLARSGSSLPVQPRKRDVFMITSPAGLPGCPLVIDPAGIWFRPEGRGFLCGAPPRADDPDEPPLTAIDHGLFDEVIWPTLAQRVPAFEAARVRSAWAGYYEMNTFDHNGIVGAWPGCTGLFVACGFSGHGMQQAPAIGEAMAAMILGERHDWLEPLSPTRLQREERLIERNVI